MALPLLTWRIGTNYAITAAGVNPTAAEILAGINTALTTEAAGSGLWEVSHYSAGNGTLEIKRKGSPSGELGTLRILLFGGSLPNAAALHTGTTAAAAAVYVGFSVDAGTTGPPNSYTAGAPYSGHWSGGVGAVGPSALVTAQNLYTYFFDADDVFGMQVGDQDSTANIVVGRLLTDPPANTGYWCCWGGGTTTQVATSFRLGSYAVNGAAPIPPAFTSSSANGRMVAKLPEGNQTACAVGAPGYVNAYPDIFGNIDLAVLDPVAVGTGAPATSPTYSFQGFMRQIRFGPIAANKAVLADVNNVVQAYHIGIGTNSSAAAGFWLDTQI